MVDVEQMVRRQRALADFGEFALRSENLDDILMQACQLISHALGTDLAKVIEIVEGTDGPALFVRAGVGWPDGIVGEMRMPMHEKSSETYAIEQGVPIVTPDINTEDRFTFPDFMKDAGVRGAVNVPIFLPGGKAYGLLQVDSREPWNPEEPDTEFLRTYSTILGPVIDRLHQIHALRLATDRNETLLRELQHRIKNNIAAITGLVRLRRNKAATEDARYELGVVGERIEALRLVHEHVYAARNADRMPLRPYVTQLLEGLLALHEETAVRLDVQMKDMEVGSDTAIPLGLILNEFTTNSMKYAFTGEDRPGEAVICIEAEQRDDQLWIRICDNGMGLPATTKESRPGSGTGMALIAGLSRQIGAKPDWSSEQGTSLCLEFQRRR